MEKKKNSDFGLKKKRFYLLYNPLTKKKVEKLEWNMLTIFLSINSFYFSRKFFFNKPKTKSFLFLNFFVMNFSFFFLSKFFYLKKIDKIFESDYSNYQLYFENKKEIPEEKKIILETIYN